MRHLQVGTGKVSQVLEDRVVRESCNGRRICIIEEDFLHLSLKFFSCRFIHKDPSARDVYVCE